MTYELNVDELNEVAGGTSYQEAFANMAKWNASISFAGMGSIEGGPSSVHPGPPPTGPKCGHGCH